MRSSSGLAFGLNDRFVCSALTLISVLFLHETLAKVNTVFVGRAGFEDPQNSTQYSKI